MKKTIITLLALAGVSAAADTTGAITLWDTGFSVTTTGDNAGQWTLSDEDEALLTSSDWVLKKADGTDLLSTTTKASELRPNTNVGTAQGWSLDFTLKNASSQVIKLTSLTFDTIIFAGGGAYQSNNTNRDFVFTLTCGDVTLNTGNLTIKGNGTASPTNGVVTFTLDTAVELAANESIALGFDVAKGTSNDGCFLGLKSISATGVTIPEPTTATLSLLALAGLAARRRRK